MLLYTVNFGQLRVRGKLLSREDLFHENMFKVCVIDVEAENSMQRVSGNPYTL